MKTEGGMGNGTPADDRRLWLAVILMVFVLSRVVFCALGIRFNTEGFLWYWQILDPGLLRSDPIGCVMWMHMQPPIFNLLLGLVLLVAPSGAAVALNGLFLLLGGSMAAVIFRMLLELGWPGRPAALVVVALMLTPGWLMYESWMFYDFPTAFLLALAALALVRWGRVASYRWLVVFVWSVCGLALLRSLFHLIWLAAAVAVVLLCRVPVPRKRAVFVVLPILLVAALYVKNFVIFGVLGPSSWLGMSVSKMTTARLEPSERERMVAGGELSPYVLVPPFGTVDAYERSAAVSFEDRERAVLGRRFKSNGQPNLNHLAYVSISKALRADALTVAWRRPEVYSQAVVNAWRRFFAPVVAYPAFEDNLLVIAPLFRLSQATLGRPFVAVIVYSAAIVFAAIGWRRARAKADRGLQAAAAFVLLNLVWVAVVGNFLEVGENHRFRFVVTPLTWFSLAAVVGPRFRLRGH